MYEYLYESTDPPPSKQHNAPPTLFVILKLFGLVSKVILYKNFSLLLS